MIGLGHQVFVVEGELKKRISRAVVRFWKRWTAWEEGEIDMG